MTRPGPRARLYSTAWDKARASYLAAHPTCARCGAKATVVHHLDRHHGKDSRTFWNKARWQPVCAACHNGPIQQQESRGYHGGIGSDGLPTDPKHPFNQGQAPS